VLSYSKQSVLACQAWTSYLLSLRISRPADFHFIAGQFARLGLAHQDSMLWRPYSIISNAHDDFLEFLVVRVANGAFSPLLFSLQVGDTLAVDPYSYGFLTLERFNDGRDLWLFATGTGLAPFLAILAQQASWQRYQHIVLVHNVRTHQELAYAERLCGWQAQCPQQFFYVPVLSQEHHGQYLHGRIAPLLADGTFEKIVGLTLDRCYSRVMLCGNPGMIREVRALCATRGIQVGRRGAPSQLAVENYW